MKKRLMEKKEKRRAKFRERLAKFLNLSWVRFEERIPDVHKDEEDEHSKWIKNF